MQTHPCRLYSSVQYGWGCFGLQWRLYLARLLPGGFAKDKDAPGAP